MILRSIAVAAILLALYQGWISWARPMPESAVNFSLDSVILAQDFLHGRHDQPIVILGSSITFKLEPYMRRPDIASLVFIGKGPSEGLTLLERCGAHPKVILVELNHIGRRPDEAFLEAVLTPELYWLQDLVPATTYCYQPANLLVPWIHSKIEGQEIHYKDETREAAPMRPGLQPPSSEGVGYRNSENMTGELKDFHAQLPVTVERIRKLGARPIAFEVPERQDVFNSPEFEDMRQSAAKEFGSPVWLDRSQRYYTQDGEHLEPDYASAYAYFLLKKIDQLGIR